MLALQCLLSCVLLGLSSETLRVRDRSTSPSASSSYQVRGSIYHAYNFQLTVPSSRIERLFDPTTYTYASMLNPKQPCPSTSQQTLFGYVTFARCSAPASMHARLYSTVILF